MTPRRLSAAPRTTDDHASAVTPIGPVGASLYGEDVAQQPHPESFTDDQLEAGAKHLAYEAWMMGSALVLSESTSHTARISPGDHVRENAALESCLTHARALLEFLGIRHRKPADMWLADFGASEPVLTAERRRSYRQRLRTIDRHLAHASWSRVAGVLDDQEDDDDDDVGPDEWLPELVAMILEDLAAVADTMREGRAKRTLRLGLQPVANEPTPGRKRGDYSTTAPTLTIIRASDFTDP